MSSQTIQSFKFLKGYMHQLFHHQRELTATARFSQLWVYVRFARASSVEKETLLCRPLGTATNSEKCVESGRHVF